MPLKLQFVAVIKTIRKLKYFFIFWSITFICICNLYFFFVQNESNKNVNDYQLHSLCIFVPFRDRFEELLEFVPHISTFLNRQNIRYSIYVINQIDDFRFNRGSLINVGFQFSTSKSSKCDYIAMHDVDLLPLNDKISYEYPGNSCFHVSSPNLHPIYHYQTFIGGILLISNHKFLEINGLSNRYWGWGLEDDEFYLRLKENKIKIFRPGQLNTNMTNTFKHIHGRDRKRDTKRCYNQAKASRKRDRVTGLNNTNYRIISAYSLTINEYPVSVINVFLNCNRELTPWCICNVTQQSKLNMKPAYI